MVLRLNMPIKQEKTEEEETEESEKLAAEKPRKAQKSPEKPLSLQLDPKHEIKRVHSNRRWDDETSKHLGSWRIGAH